MGILAPQAKKVDLYWENDKTVISAYNSRNIRHDELYGVGLADSMYYMENKKTSA
jgi:hypothetical protein